MGDEFDEALRKFATTSSASASSIADLAAALGVSTERAREASSKAANYTFNSSYPVYPKYTPEQLVAKLVKTVKDSDLDDDELRALVGSVITSVTNQLYEIIKERES